MDRFTPGEWDLTLTLFTGKTLQLRQFGASFPNMQEELLAAWRDRTVRCLLLEDLEEGARFDAASDGVRGQVRLYGSNFATLPLGGDPTQVRLADVGRVTFDESRYSVAIEAATGRLVISKLAQKTEEFREKPDATLGAIRFRTADTLRRTFPFLDPDQLRRLTTAMLEGRSVARETLATIDPRLPDSLVAKVIDESLQPYFDELRKRSTGTWHAGFKFTRPDEQDESEGPLFFWFFLPLAGKDLVAWEATAGSGRATYFFRASTPLDRLTRGLALVNFRREPVYLSDDSLAQQSKFHRYAIGARKLADLRSLRVSFAGRAIHSSVEEWVGQIP